MSEKPTEERVANSVKGCRDVQKTENQEEVTRFDNEKTTGNFGNNILWKEQFI